MEKVVKYPLTQVPLSVANIDGSMKETTKVELLQELESRIESVKPACITFLFINNTFISNVRLELAKSQAKLSNTLRLNFCY